MNKKISSLALAFVAAATLQTHASTITKVDVTTTLGPNFFFDAAAIGGGDSTAAPTVSFVRDFGILSGSPSTVSITGLGWAASGSGVTALFTKATISFLGANNVVGGGDDVLFGTVTDSLAYTGAGEYSWSFNSPLSLNITPNPTVNNFSIIFSGFTDNTEATPANLRFKTTTGTALSAVKLSVAGTAVAVPEPSTLALVGLGIAGLLGFRRK